MNMKQGGSRDMAHHPPMTRPKNNDGYFEEMSKVVFRAGLNWSVIESLRSRAAAFVSRTRVTYCMGDSPTSRLNFAENAERDKLTRHARDSTVHSSSGWCWINVRA